MRQCVRVLLLALLLAALPTGRPAEANPESGPWVNAETGVADRLVEFGETIRFSITSATDSETFTLVGPKADLCYDPDTGGAAGAARVAVYRVITPSAVTINGSILLPTIPIDNSDCTIIVSGTYWVEVTTGPTGGETPIVTVSARSN